MSCISVLMPVYNAEIYLREAVESILNQTFSDFKFLIINDGSTDQSEAILQEFQKQDKRIKIISRSNKGLIATLNEGLDYANERYIARMDADDIALPERFAKQVAFLEENPDYVAVGSQVLLIDPEGWPISLFSQQTSHEEIDDAHMKGKGGAICHPAVMLRRDALKNIGGYRQQMKHSEDLDLFLRLAEIGRLANLSDILLQYRMHPNSIGNSHRLEQTQTRDLAVQEAHCRRAIALPTTLNSNEQQQYPIDALHRKWAWWSLNAGYLATARKHALLAVKKNPISLESWKVLAFAMCGNSSSKSRFLNP
ncbi:glycosyltransferase [Lyngbya aestuarii]|uniref:glycosyltransferase n=1 Tax=Lyngbya aestuarii TaxID=118322 RepID=UPI00403D960C